MLSQDQRGYLNYQPPGVLVDLAGEYHVNDWLGIQLGAVSGVFFSSAPAGTLLAPVLGAIARLGTRTLQPFFALDVGAGFTGHIVRPFGRALVGFDAPFGERAQWRVGPALGLDVVTQRNGAGFSSDAIYAWLGLSVNYRFTTDPSTNTIAAAQSAELPARPAAPAAALRTESHEPPAPDDAHAPPTAAADTPPELDALLDTAVRSEHFTRTELLAPLLFTFDSATLEPSSVAMLHEVVRVLNHERRDLARLQIIAYADARGSTSYNHALAERRAQRVLEWLVEHGVARERLEVSAQGAVDFVEAGDTADDHQQNRRVIFRERSESANGGKQ